MNWRAVFLWAAFSLAAWFILVVVTGMAAAWVIQQRTGLTDLPLGQAGVLAPVAISIGLLPRLAAGFLLAALLWAALARRFSGMERDRKKFAGLLAAFALAAGFLFGWALPLNPPFALYGGLLFAASLALPRFTHRGLFRGVFPV